MYAALMIGSYELSTATNLDVKVSFIAPDARKAAKSRHS